MRGTAAELAGAKLRRRVTEDLLLKDLGVLGLRRNVEQRLPVSQDLLQIGARGTAESIRNSRTEEPVLVAADEKVSSESAGDLQLFKKQDTVELVGRGCAEPLLEDVCGRLDAAWSVRDVELDAANRAFLGNQDAIVPIPKDALGNEVASGDL
jgi:hypothetical protein